MAINVGTLALSISVNEKEVLRKLQKVDAAAAKVGSGRLAAEFEMARESARNATAMHLAAEKNKTKITLAEIRARTALETAAMRKAAASRMAGMAGGGMPGLGLIGLSSTVLGGMAFRGLVTAANDFQLLQQRLAQVTDTAAEAKTAFDILQRASMQLRVPTADLTELFVKLRQSNSALGFNMGQTTAMTRAFAAALRISGASGQAASSALLQFGQAMAKGRLDGDEFRTVAENASEVLRVLERYLNQTGEGARLFGKKTAITRGEILKLREEGKLAADVLGKALLWDLKNLERQASRLPPTMDQAATMFRNSVLKMIGASSDLQTAMQNIANAIVRVGNFLSSNGNLIIGLTSVALKMGALIAVSRMLIGVWNIIRLHPMVATLTAIGIALIWLAEKADLGRARLQDLLNQRVESNLNTLKEKIDDIVFALDAVSKKAAQAAFDAALVPYIATAAVSEQRIAALEKERDALLAKERSLGPFAAQARREELSGAIQDNKRLLEIEKQLTDERLKSVEMAQTVADARKQLAFALRGGGGGGGGGGGTGTVKNTIDQEIAALGKLAEAGVLTEEQKKRLQALYKAEARVFADSTAGAIRQGQALDRLNTITGIYGELMKSNWPEIEKTKKRVELLVAAVEALGASMSKGDQRLLAQNLREAEVQLRRMQAAGAAGLLSPEGLEKLTAHKELVDQLRKAYENLLLAMGGGTAEQKKTPAERLSELLDRQLFRQLALAPGQLVSDFFAAIGKSIDDGSQSVGAKLRESLGNIFSNVGQNVIQQGFEELMPSFGDMWDILKKGFGTLMKKLGMTTGIFGKIFTKLQALMVDPLFAGPAMIALGAAMVAFGGALGGAATGRDGGGFTGGGIGGLGIGGTTSPVPYVFQNRPYQSPMQGMGGVPEGRNTVNVNATIIGPNDPQAQRQIATLVNNAARRGLVTGPSSRTN